MLKERANNSSYNIEPVSLENESAMIEGEKEKSRQCMTRRQQDFVRRHGKIH